MRKAQGMEKVLDRSQLDRLPVADRLRLLEDVWASLEQNLDPVPTPDWHHAELDRRLAAHAANATAVKPWRDVLADLRAERSK
jgi:putative addiction module component (TIGR02574 family)